VSWAQSCLRSQEGPAYQGQEATRQLAAGARRSAAAMPAVQHDHCFHPPVLSRQAGQLPSKQTQGPRHASAASHRQEQGWTARTIRKQSVGDVFYVGESVSRP
jgi:hypothetical protein